MQIEKKNIQEKGSLLCYIKIQSVCVVPWNLYLQSYHWDSCSEATTTHDEQSMIAKWAKYHEHVYNNYMCIPEK